MTVNYLLLALSVTLTSSRNAITKRTALNTGSCFSDFFFAQTMLFLSSAVVLTLVNLTSLSKVSGITVLYGIIYGILLILSQWMLTLSLKSGETSICSTIYALGLIFPTISGALFWDEPFAVKEGIGLALVLAVIFLSVKSGNKTEKNRSISFLPYILVAMFASGGLGILQKLQQSSSVPEEKGAFLLIAFLIAIVSSLIAYLCCKEKNKIRRSTVVYPSFTGVCFGGANFCNTILAGRMKSSVVFPLQNISTILLSTLLGIVIFKEKITPRIAIIIALSVSAVLIFSL